MPDLDLMPPGHLLVAAQRPPAGLGDVLARATRRRRRQQAGALATGAAACAAVFAISFAGGSAVDSLGVTPAHPVDGQGSTVTEQTQAVDPAPAHQADPPVAAQQTTTRANGGGGDTARAVVPGTTTDSVAAAQQGKPGGEVGPPHTTIAYDPSHGCNAAGPTVASGWCSYYDGALSGRSGQRVELAEALCRLPGQGAGRLQTDNGQQAEFTVTNQDSYLAWQWSRGHRFSKARTSLDVAAGTCLRWHVTWNVVDVAGRPLPAGAYNLDARPLAYPSSATGAYVGAWAQFVTFTVIS
jgi:hypothetical protein